VGACPCVEQAVATDDFAFRRGMKCREALFDMRAHAAECFGVLVGLFVAGNGSEADRFGQALGRGLCVDLGTRHRRHLKLPRTMGEGVECESAGEDDDNSDREQQDVAADPDETSHGEPPQSRHARPCAWHPRLDSIAALKTWMAGTSSAKTRFALLPGHDGEK